jgi:hypothetical protein
MYSRTNPPVVSGLLADSRALPTIARITFSPIIVKHIAASQNNSIAISEKLPKP